MKQASNEIRAFWGQSIPLDVDVYAGDSWQLLVSEPGDALRAALVFRASVLAATDRRVDSRLAIALDKIDFIPGERVSEGDVAAFRLSGRLLRETDRKPLMQFVANPPDRGEPWDATLGLLDAVIRRWSTKQAIAVLGALQGRFPAEIGEHENPPVQRQTVSGTARLKGVFGHVPRSIGHGRFRRLFPTVLLDARPRRRSSRASRPEDGRFHSDEMSDNFQGILD